MWSEADWVNTGLASFSVLVAIGGVGIVVWQVRKARGAAEAARDAATSAREGMARRVTSADLEVVRRVLREMLDDLQGGEIQTLWADCQDARERLMEMRARPGLGDQQQHLTFAITGLREIQENITADESATSDFDTSASLQAVLETVVELQQRALFFEGEATSDEQRAN